MYLFTFIKCDLIANDFSIGRYRDITMNTGASVCTFLLCNLLKCVVPNSRPASARMFRIWRIWTWMWGSTKCCLIALFKQLWACSTGLKNGQYGGNMTTWNLSSSSGGTTMMLRCGRAPSKMMKISSLIGTRGEPRWPPTHWRVIVLCWIMWWTKSMWYDMASVMLTFLRQWSYEATDSFV